MTTMYDTSTPSQIPTSAQIVAGYINGRYAWKDTDWARFPAAKHVRITVDPTVNDGDVYDCEPGNRSNDPNVWPAQTAAWVHARVNAGIVPVVYCDLSDWQALKTTVAGCEWWIADPHTNGAPIDGAIAVQYAWPGDPATQGLNVDVSYVYGSPLDINNTEQDDDMTPEQSDKLDAVYEALYANDAAKDPNGTPMTDHWAIGYIWSEVQAIKSKIGA